MVQEPGAALLVRYLRSDEAALNHLPGLDGAAWAGVVAQAEQHDLAPLLYHRLRGRLPPARQERLQARYREAAKQNMRLYYDLARLLQALRAEDITPIVLKGAYLAAAIYDDIALRPMQDIDLLLQPEALKQAEARLLALGYTPHRENAEFATYHCHLAYWPPQGDISVELHWHIQRLDAPFQVEVGALWQAARRATIAGQEALALAPELLLLHLCLHAAYDHLFAFGLRPLVDVAETVRVYQARLDWERVARCARQWGLARAVYLTLHLAHALLAAPVPGEWLAALRPEGFEPQVAAWAKEQVFREPAAPAALSQDFARLWAAESPPGRLAFLLKKLFPPPQIMSKLYPVEPDSGRVYLYYPARLKDMALAQGMLAWRLWRGDKRLKSIVRRENNKAALRQWLAG